MSVRSLNKVMLIGNLTRDPNLRYTPSGTAVCSFGLATNRSWTPSDGGERQERVDFHNVVAWAKLAEICGQIIHKGDKVYVEGRIQTRDWKTDDGVDRRITEIVIDNMMLLGNPRGSRRFQNDDDDLDVADVDADENEAPAKEEKSKSAKSAESKKKAKAEKKEEAKEEETVEAEDVSVDIPF